jgi:hypothetical protein
MGNSFYHMFTTRNPLYVHFIVLSTKPRNFTPWHFVNKLRKNWCLWDHKSKWEWYRTPCDVFDMVRHNGTHSVIIGIYAMGDIHEIKDATYDKYRIFPLFMAWHDFYPTNCIFSVPEAWSSIELILEILYIVGNYTFFAESSPLLFDVIRQASSTVKCSDPDHQDQYVLERWTRTYQDPENTSQPK